MKGIFKSMWSEVSFSSLLQVYKSCFTQYFTLSGRAGRRELIIFFMVNWFLSLLLDYIPLAGTLFSLFLIFPTLSLFVRRLHDFSMSGWWLFFLLSVSLLCSLGVDVTDSSDEDLRMLLVSVTLICLAAPIPVLFLLPGTKGENRYGAR